MAELASEGVDAPTVVEEIEIVTFEDEGSVEAGTLASPTSMPEQFAGSAREGREHTVVDFLSRPMKLINFLWLATMTPNTDLFVVNFPNDLFKQPAVYEKIKGFTWFRGEMVLRVNVNAQKFQQGRLLLYFIPYRFTKGSDPASTALTSKTGFPRVDIDLAQSQSMTIRLPFVAPMSHLNLIYEEWSIGTVVATVYGKLAGGTAPSIGGSVWAHFENVEIQLPTGVKPYIVPLPEASSSSYIKTFAQANIKGEKAASGGTISGAARAVGSVATMAANIPGISTFAAPIAAAAGVVGSLASAFGFSKPLTEKLAEPIQISTARNTCNFNGIDMSKRLAMDATNSISNDAIFGSKVDEMSLAYIAGTPNYYETFDYTTTQTADTVLYSTPVCPVGKLQPYKDYTDMYIFTHLAYIARMFDFWSGSIKFKLRFVKTKFHSGRLRVSIVPMGIVGATVKAFDANKCKSYIIDLKEKSEFEFSVPYTFNAPMMPTGGGSSNNSIPVAPAHSVVVITVLNELVTPSTLVSDTVNVIVEKAGGDDIAFHVPRRVNGVTIYTDDGVPPPPPPSIKKTYAQMDVGREDVQMGNDSPVQLFNSEYSTNPTDSLGCVGETIVSARQLLKRFQPVGTLDLPNVVVSPYVVKTFTTLDFPATDIYTDYYSWIAPLFAFMRGGMRIKCFYLGTSESNDLLERVLLGKVQGQDPNTSLLAASTTVPGHLTDSNIPNVPMRDGCLEFEVPYYNQYPMVPVPFALLHAPTQNMGNPGLSRCAYILSNASSTSERVMYRAVAEDFQLGFLIGTPPVYLKL